MNFIYEHRWVIPDMYWPEKTSSLHYKSHESVCILNLTNSDCEVLITLYYEDSEPIKLPVQFCKNNRTNHIRMDLITDTKGKHIPRGIAYAAVVECSTAAIVQYTRVDTTDADTALMTTMAYKLNHDYQT